MAIAIPEDIRALLEGRNFVHLSTLRQNGAPRNWVVWVGLEGEHILVCTGNDNLKALDMRHDPRVGLSVADFNNPYAMAGLQGRVIEERPDPEVKYMDAISMKYVGKPVPSRSSDRACFVIEVEKAGRRTLGFKHEPD
jgi:PPOX class probable F420-dependent enzyme